MRVVRTIANVTSHQPNGLYSRYFRAPTVATNIFAFEVRRDGHSRALSIRTLLLAYVDDPLFPFERTSAYEIELLSITLTIRYPSP